MTTTLANREPDSILKQSKSPIFLETRDLLFARAINAPTAILNADSPGDEVASTFLALAIQWFHFHFNEQQVISELPFASVSKRYLMHSLSYGKEFDLQDNERACKTHFHMKGCAPGLVLKQEKGNSEILMVTMPPSTQENRSMSKYWG